MVAWPPLQSHVLIWSFRLMDGRDKGLGQFDVYLTSVGYEEQDPKRMVIQAKFATLFT